MIYEQVMKIQAVAAVYRSRSHEKEMCSRDGICMNMSCEHVCTGTHNCAEGFAL